MFLSYFLSTLLVFSIPSLSKVDIPSLRVVTTPTQNAKELVNKSTIIVVGEIEGMQEYPTSQRMGDGVLVNYVQTIKVKKIVKGKSVRIAQLLTSGVEPQPKPADPLNLTYPGPLTDGTYVCFLRSVPGTNLYSLVGIWQGVYPIVQGKTIALRGIGYSEFHNLTVAQISKKIRGLNP